MCVIQETTHEVSCSTKTVLLEEKRAFVQIDVGGVNEGMFCGILEGRQTIECWGQDEDIISASDLGWDVVSDSSRPLQMYWKHRTTLEERDDSPGTTFFDLRPTGQYHQVCIGHTGPRYPDAGGPFGCAIRSRDQHLVCFGNNDFGTQNIPTLVSDFPFTSLSCGRTHVCGIYLAEASERNVVCWGNNPQWVGSNIMPIGGLTMPPNNHFEQLSSGTKMTCGVVSETNRVVCWGEVHMEGGPGDYNIANTPMWEVRCARESGASGWIGDHCCGLVKANLHALCWGFYPSSWSGDPPPAGHLNPPHALFPVTYHGADQNYNIVHQWNWESDRSYLSLAVGAGISCGVRASTQKIECWGESGPNDVTQPWVQSTTLTGMIVFGGVDIGDPTMDTLHPTPYPTVFVPPTLTDITHNTMCSGQGFVCYILDDKSLHCQGSFEVPAPFASISFKEVQCSFDLACAIRDDNGGILCAPFWNQTVVIQDQVEFATMTLVHYEQPSSLVLNNVRYEPIVAVVDRTGAIVQGDFGGTHFEDYTNPFPDVLYRQLVHGHRQVCGLHSNRTTVSCWGPYRTPNTIHLSSTVERLLLKPDSDICYLTSSVLFCLQNNQQIVDRNKWFEVNAYSRLNLPSEYSSLTGFTYHLMLDCSKGTSESCTQLDEDLYTQYDENIFPAVQPGNISGHCYWNAVTNTCYGAVIRRFQAPPNERLRSLAIARDHSCAILEDGQVRCWGYGEEENGEGLAEPSILLRGGHQCGTYHSAASGGGFSTFRCEQSNPPPFLRLQQITVDENLSCGLDEQENLVCWGKLVYPQLAPFTITPLTSKGRFLGPAGWSCNETCGNTTCVVPTRTGEEIQWTLAPPHSQSSTGGFQGDCATACQLDGMECVDGQSISEEVCAALIESLVLTDPRYGVLQRNEEFLDNESVRQYGDSGAQCVVLVPYFASVYGSKYTSGSGSTHCPNQYSSEFSSTFHRSYRNLCPCRKTERSKGIPVGEFVSTVEQFSDLQDGNCDLGEWGGASQLIVGNLLTPSALGPFDNVGRSGFHPGQKCAVGGTPHTCLDKQVDHRLFCACQDESLAWLPDSGDSSTDATPAPTLWTTNYETIGLVEHGTFEYLSLEFCAPCDSTIELTFRHRSEFWGTHMWAQDEWHPICSPNVGHNYNQGEQFEGRTCYNSLLSPSTRRSLRDAGTYGTLYATCLNGKWSTGTYHVRGFFANLENQFRLQVGERQFLTDQREGTYGHVTCSPDGDFISMTRTNQGNSTGMDASFVPPTPAPTSGSWGSQNG